MAMLWGGVIGRIQDTKNFIYLYLPFVKKITCGYL